MANPFIGPSYTLNSKPTSVQRLVNMMPVPLEPGNERAGWVFKDVPGLVKLTQTLYYTSIIYPIFTEEHMTVTTQLRSGSVLTVDSDATTIPVPTLRSGTLAATISFLSYTNGLLAPDPMKVFVPSLSSGTLAVTITYVTYNNNVTFPDPMQVFVPTLRSGTLAVTINYITYTNSITYPDPMKVFVPTLQSGTLV